MLFNQVQEPLLLKKLSELEEKAESALTSNSMFLSERLMDLRLYRAQLKKILLTTLYYLEVTADGNTLYKIGVTQRSIAERVTEIQSDLRCQRRFAQRPSHFQVVTIKVLGTWEHRGNVEKYFKHRYQDFNYPIGNLTEYYKFDDPNDAKATLRDLRRMKPKVLSSTEIALIEDQPNYVQQAVQAV